jgi:hypothetical protein
MEGSNILGDLTTTRFIASRGYNIMIRALFGLDYTDTQCGAKFFKADALQIILKRIKLTDLSFDINLLYELHRAGFNVKEVPITYSIVNEHSKVNVGKQIPKMFVITLGYRITKSPLNKIIPHKFKGQVFNRIRRW